MYILFYELWFTGYRVLVQLHVYVEQLSGISGLEYWTGILEWNTGLEYWNGLNCCKKIFLEMATI